MLIVPNNWAELQHYKDRSPPWIKLHKKLLDNYEFQSLPVASRALAPMLWLLASEHKNGVIDATPEKIAFRLRMSESAAKDALKPLIEKGFFSVVDGDSGVLADRKRGAMPETEAEKRERRDRQARDFKTFYAAYPKKKAPADAEKAFAKVDVAIEVLIAAIESQKQTDDWRKEGGRYIPYPATWLNQRQWENAVDAPMSVTVPAAANASAALEKIKSDAAKAAPPSLETLQRMAELRRGVPRETGAHQ